MLIYIENKKLASKIITYLDYINKNYTLDIKANYEYILVGQLNKKTLELCENKKVIFITYLIEEKLSNIFIKNNKSIRTYRNFIINNFNKFDKIIVSLESIKNELSNIIKTNIEVINKELPIINISSNNKEIYARYNIKKRRKNILFIDFDYKYIEYIYNLSNNYPKLNFIYLGFKPYYELSKKNKEIYNKLNSNITLIKYYDLNIFSDLVKLSNIIINTSDLILNTDYLYTIFLFRRKFISIENLYYDNYLINSKHIYIFEKAKELKIKFDKVLNDKLQDLTENAYDIIKDNSFTNISKKYSTYLN